MKKNQEHIEEGERLLDEFCEKHRGMPASDSFFLALVEELEQMYRCLGLIPSTIRAYFNPNTGEVLMTSDIIDDPDFELRADNE